MSHFRQFSFKQFGYFDFNFDIQEQLQKKDFKEYIKIVFFKAGAQVVVDFTEYILEQDALFFINAGQYFAFNNDSTGTLLYYNRDFYCVEIHDKEVACDGILFHNVYEIPVIFMNQEISAMMQAILAEIKQELELNDTTMEEMLRILLKQVIIKSTRVWKQSHQFTSEEVNQEVEFSRTFSQLVEWNYTRFHSVADYSELLHITPKALNKRITRYSNTSPNEIIKNRIILEAKRLLVHTQLSVKEIGYKLGYEDTSYFIRLFTNHTSNSPQSFRLHYQNT
ncbi:helix-turn-helix transcriptional regulator [Xanthocytophaga agilis]|uniref:Helix-turn-helix transcriptional regulator n=1 Tax=Xanthocytophaga agilis TaxID=3048010 RepID=A0AAE3R4M8_9BACT|nr:helix-turn-helix transcriptional regulator [Xanthocytophaga agilis]MDJ1500783.1 helix-turn-helix transcriptional regulator [Xanthocytophaga agilis]